MGIKQKEFKLPDLGEGIHEGQILKVLVDEGDLIKEDDLILEVETDKATVEITSPYEGKISKVHIKNAQVVNVGDIMLSFVLEPNLEIQNIKTDKLVTNQIEKNFNTESNKKTLLPKSPRTPASPSARRLAKKNNIDISLLIGSGPNGRVTHKDITNAINNKNTSKEDPNIEIEKPPSQIIIKNLEPIIKEKNYPFTNVIDLEIEGGKEDENQFGKIIRQPLTLARKTIAKTMSEAWSTIPHVTDTEDADITEIEELRSKINKNNNSKISALPFIIKAVTRALEKFPLINSSLDEKNNEIIYHRYVNICIGIESNRGIIAPVLHNLSGVGVSEISSRLNLLIENVRSGQFSNEDIKGGTYTISNAGALGGSRYATPIITPPQVAVLSLGRSRLLPWVVGEKIKPRLILPISHSMDHRVIDGGREIPFLMHLVEDLQNPLRFSL